MARLRNRVREVRKAMGKSLADLAAETRLSRTTIGAVERETTVPSGTVMLVLSTALKKPVQDLFYSEPTGSEPFETVAS